MNRHDSTNGAGNISNFFLNVTVRKEVLECIAGKIRP